MRWKLILRATGAGAVGILLGLVISKASLGFGAFMMAVFIFSAIATEAGVFLMSRQGNIDPK